MIEFTCACGKRMVAKEENAGRISRCIGCGKQLVIPRPVVAEEETAEGGEEASGRDYAYLVLLLAVVPLVLQAAAVTFGGAAAGKGAAPMVPATAAWGRGVLMGVGAWAGFMGLLVGVFPEAWGRRKELLAVAGGTLGAGVVMLLVSQWLAGILRGWIIEGAGPFAFPFMALRFVVGSYDAAADPKTNYWIGAFAFTIGVGLVGAAIGALPVVWHFVTRGTLGWRGAMAWGMAAGVGLGVAEAVCYSAWFDAGHAGGLGYAVRFVSGVAVQVVLAGSVGVFTYQQRKMFESSPTVIELLSAVLGVIVVAIILGGQIDTMMKKGMWWGAAGVAGVAIGVLGAQVEGMRKGDAAERGKR